MITNCDHLAFIQMGRHIAANRTILKRLAEIDKTLPGSALVSRGYRGRPNRRRASPCGLECRNKGLKRFGLLHAICLPMHGVFRHSCSASS